MKEFEIKQVVYVVKGEWYDSFYIEKGIINRIFKDSISVKYKYYTYIEQKDLVFLTLEEAKDFLKLELLKSIEKSKERTLELQVYHDKLEEGIEEQELIKLNLFIKD